MQRTDCLHTLAQFNATWQPFERVGGAACRSMSRFGPPLGKQGEGGKTLCDANALLRDPDCLIVSVGLNEDTRFEQSLHRAAPHCEIIGMDGTLDASKKAAVPKFINFVPMNYNRSTYRDFAGRHVRLLKIDCDGCEYSHLPSWVDHVCTEQIVVEVHRFTFVHPYTNAIKIHNLMLHLHARGYRVAFLEPNPMWPKLGTEYTMVRNSSC